MSSRLSADLYPVMIGEDRYQGVYAGGPWWAIANGDLPFGDTTRIAWLMKDGPGGDDVTAGLFWANPPPWIATGASPDEALAGLLSEDGVGSDDWSPPPIESDPRWRSCDP